jgi:malonate transporter and related proteins
MSAILNITGPIFLIIGLGYFSVRWGLFERAHMRVLGRFVMFVALPALLFKALASRSLADIVHTDYLLVYALGSAAPLALMLWWQRHQGASHARAGTMAMGVSCPNSGFVGFPIMLLLMPQVAPIVLALNMVVENFFTLPLTMAYSERKSGEHGHWGHAVWHALKPLRTNPLFIAIVLGGAFATTGLHLPLAVNRSIDVLAQAAGGTALFAIGGGLVGLQIKGLRRLVAGVVVGKLLIHPLATAVLAFVLLPIADPLLRTAAVLSTAMPMLGVYPLLASRVGEEDLASAALLATTIGSFVTLSAAIALLGLAGTTGMLG